MILHFPKRGRALILISSVSISSSAFLHSRQFPSRIFWNKRKRPLHDPFFPALPYGRYLKSPISNIFLISLCRFSVDAPLPAGNDSMNVPLPELSNNHTLMWTACNKCHGEGRRYQRSRQSRRHKLPNGESKSTMPQTTTTQMCKHCAGSGLIPLSSEVQTTPLEASPVSSLLQEPRPVLRIAIIGGGIAGLALAAACQHRRRNPALVEMQVTVYERDASFTMRNQGYGLTLQQASAQLAALGILELAEGITSTKHIVHDEKGNVRGTWGMRHWVGNAEPNNPSPTSSTSGETPPLSCQKQRRRPRQNVHIARQALRHELFVAATAQDRTPSLVQWNHRLIHYQEKDDSIDLMFEIQNADGSTRMIQTQTDLLVGADGIRSQVRQQYFALEDDPLRYLGCIVILGICPLTAFKGDTVRSDFAHLLDGETVFQTADGTTRIYMMPYSRREYMWQLSFPMDEAAAKELSRCGSGALQQAAVERCQTWHSPIPEILGATPGDLISGYPVYDREIVQQHQLQNRSLRQECLSPNLLPRRVTFLGDAVHCMSPFKGQGANQALLDALSLARSLYKMVRTTVTVSAVEIERALIRYESEMLERSARKVQASAEAAIFLHTPLALHEGNVTRGAAAAEVRNCT